jgi:outer membrane protein
MKHYKTMMRTGCMLLTLALLPAGSAGIAAEPQALTLEATLAVAQENNRDILVAVQESQIAAARVREERSAAMPDIRWGGTYTRTLRNPAFFVDFDGDIEKLTIGAKNSITQALILDQALYSGGKVGTAIKLSKDFLELTETELSHTRRVVRHEVTKQFYTILMAREALRIAEETLTQGQRYHRNVEQRYAQGLVSEFELLRSEVQSVNHEPGVIQAENSLNLSRTSLMNLLTLDTKSAVNFQGELEYVPVDPQLRIQLPAEAATRRTDYQQLTIQQRMRHLNIKLERGERLPTLRLLAKWQHDGVSNDFVFGKLERVWSSDVALRLEVPIFDGFRASARTQQALIETEKLDQRMAQLQEAIDLEIQQADLRMKEAEKRLGVQERNIEQARRAYDIAQVRFNNGLGTQLEVFDSQLDVVVNELGHVQAIYDYLIAKTDWEFAIGL